MHRPVSHEDHYSWLWACFRLQKTSCGCNCLLIGVQTLVLELISMMCLFRCRTGEEERSARRARRRCTTPRRSSVTAGASTRPASSAVSLLLVLTVPAESQHSGLTSHRLRVLLSASVLTPLGAELPSRKGEAFSFPYFNIKMFMVRFHVARLVV